MLLQHLDGGGEPGAGGRFRFAEWSVVRLGCGGVRVKNDFVFTNLDLILYSTGTGTQSAGMMRLDLWIRTRVVVAGAELSSVIDLRPGYMIAQLYQWSAARAEMG